MSGGVETASMRKREHGMKSAGRMFLVTIVVLGIYALTYWLSLALVPFEAYELVVPLVALLCAYSAGRFASVSLGSSAPGGIGRTTLLWAVVAGAIGFVCGFFFPIVFLPTANQGPLLGIFITGPLGFFLGGVAGFIYALRQKRKIGASKEFADAS